MTTGGKKIRGRPLKKPRPKEEQKECPVCGGLGEVQGCIETYDGPIRPLCPECRGSGTVARERE